VKLPKPFSNDSQSQIVFFEKNLQKKSKNPKNLENPKNQKNQKNLENPKNLK